MFERGDVVSVDFPFADGGASKVRPALVLSNATIATTGNLIIAMISSRPSPAAPNVPLAPDMLSHPLPKSSNVRCHRLYTIDAALVRARYSRVSDEGMQLIFETVVSILR
jgi:mRNA interferase MazF